MDEACELLVVVDSAPPEADGVGSVEGEDSTFEDAVQNDGSVATKECLPKAWSNEGSLASKPLLGSPPALCMSGLDQFNEHVIPSRRPPCEVEAP